VIDIQDSRMGIYVIAENKSVNTKQKRNPSHTMVTQFQPLKSCSTARPAMAPCPTITAIAFVLASQTQEAQSFLD
jgi:hypothetical protein